MSELLVAIALWCGQPFAVVRTQLGREDWLITQSAIQTCRKKILDCQRSTKGVLSLPVDDKCFPATVGQGLGS